MNLRKRNIRVATIFEPDGRIRPVWFAWNREKRTVIETTYTWEERRGEARLYHFAVRDAGGLYELVYDATDQSWCLAGLDATP